MFFAAALVEGMYEARTAAFVAAFEVEKRRAYNISMVRGPMIEADIDYRASQERRLMQEEDL